MRRRHDELFGLTLEHNHGLVTIMRVGGIAESCGCLVGDKVESINGRVAATLNSDEMARLVHTNTILRVTIQRGA